jgi:type VI secretion system lysozyme-like protein
MMAILDRYRELTQPEGEVHSVVENLRHVLNNKAGYYSIDATFGLSDLAATRDRTQALRRLAQEIRDNIRRYEPRLQIDSLITQGRGPDFLLRMELRGTLRGRPQRLLISFHQLYAHCEVRALHVE